MENVELICYKKTQDGKIVSHIEIPTSGYLALKEPIEFQENMVLFPEEVLLLEVIKSQKYCSIMTHNLLDSIKNKKIYEQSLYERIPGIVVGKRHWHVFLGDVIKVGSLCYLVGGLSYHKNLDVLRHSELETSSQLTVFHKQSLYKNQAELEDICFICKQSGQLFQACECSLAHSCCMKERFKD